MIQEKAKALYDNLNQKEGDVSKAGEFNTNKGWIDSFTEILYCQVDLGRTPLP